jgi:hypothetical protein
MEESYSSNSLPWAVSCHRYSSGPSIQRTSWTNTVSVSCPTELDGKRLTLTSSRSSDSGQKATHYINATTIQTGAGVEWDYVGCYQDAIWNDTGPGPEGRTLNGMSLNWTGNMTNELCADACADYRYFGTEYCQCRTSLLRYSMA